MPSLFHTLLYRKLYQHPLVKAYTSQHEISLDRVGWGYKASGKAALKRPDAVLFEDGFIRSLFPGYKQISYSIVTDHSGIYYDATGKSDLIKFLNGASLPQEHWNREISCNEIKKSLERVKSAGVSKYNCHLHQHRQDQFDDGVLVVDQTKGDSAIKYAGIEEADFTRMLNDALNDTDLPVYIKTHPDHQYRQKHSCFDEDLLKNKRITILPSNMPTAEALSFCHTVYVGSSLLGMEALIHKKKVITYGWNFYAGWGLTEDRGSEPMPPRKAPISLERLFEAAYLRYTHYFDPDTQEPCDIHRVIDHILHQWKQWELRKQNFVTCGLSPWKEQLLPDYLGPKNDETHDDEALETKNMHVITWGAKEVPEKLHHLPLTRIEDGFIRSRGLGANFNFPLSWVFDDVGIYFDARSPSKLENLLNTYVFTETEIQQAEELITFLKENKLTKYNLGLEKVTLPSDSKDKTIILIPGQVDSDASIKFGSPKLTNNRELLAEVRRQNPDAYICYKPHPDLLSGARKDAPLWDGIEQDVDHLVTEGDIISWIQAVDEIHTLTSTVGFEALLHDKPVSTYGLPFYAGWGLTSDWIQCDRRTRKLSFPELACAALILYPTYLNPKTREFTTAINAAKLLSNPDFNYDSRSGFLKVLGKVKSWYYKLRR